MKKIVSLLLCILMIAAPMCISASAQESKRPLIVVTGYGTPSIYLKKGEDGREKIWQFGVPDVLKYIAGDFKTVAKSLADFAIGDTETVGETVAKAGNIILPEMYCNPDGTPVYDMEHYPNDPAITSYAYLRDNNLSENIYESWLCKPLSEGLISDDNIFIFQYDFRMSGYDITNELNQYVSDVLSYTGAKQVDIFGLSYGGFLTGTFLSRFGTDGRVNNAVLNVPALGGTKFAKHFLDGTADFPVVDVISYLNAFTGIELDARQTVGFIDNDGFNRTGAAFLNGIKDMYVNWCSLWDLLSIEDYKELRGMLDPVKNAEIIRKSDYVHNEIMPNYNKNLTACMDAGVKVSIISNTGYSCAFGSDELADMLVECKYSTGSTCTKSNERFSNGYKGVHTVCTNPAHNHISPSMQIDATGAYLPENTWFMDGQGHGVYFTEEYTLSLIEKLLFTDVPINIYSDPAYPQFQISSLSTYGVYAKFDSSSSGYITSADKALVVTNVSKRYPVKISSIECEGIDISFDLSEVKTILPGKSVSIPFNGEVPEVSATYAGITVDFVRIGSPTPVNYRTFNFTVNNGAAPEYDGTRTTLSVKDGPVQKITALLSKIFLFIVNSISKLAH